MSVPGSADISQQRMAQSSASNPPTVSWDWSCPMFIAEPADSNVQPAYCRNLVYGEDGVERSLEELRGVEWRRHQGTASRLRQDVAELDSRLERQRQCWLKEKLDLESRLAEQNQRIEELRCQLLQKCSTLQTVQRDPTPDSSLSVTTGSPTVNTREALNFVRKACDDSMDCFGAGSSVRADFVAGKRQLYGGSAAAAPVQPFFVHVDSTMTEDNGPCAPPGSFGLGSIPSGNLRLVDSDKENQPPPLSSAVNAQKNKIQKLDKLAASDEVIKGTDRPSDPVMPPPLQQNSVTAAYKQTTELDGELTGFCALPDVSMCPDPDVFAAGACRVSSTPFVTSEQQQAARAELEEDEFTANVYRPRAPATTNYVATTKGNAPSCANISTIMEASREKFQSSSSGTGGSDRSAMEGHMTAGCVSTTSVAATHRVNASSSVHMVATPVTAPVVDTLRSGYLGDGSSLSVCAQLNSKTVATTDHCLSPRRPTSVAECSAADFSTADINDRNGSQRLSSVAASCDTDPATDTARAMADLSLSFQPPADLTMPLPCDQSSSSPTSAAGHDIANESIFDPWDESLLGNLLDKVKPPLVERSCFLSEHGKKMPSFSGKKVELGEEFWTISLVGEGSYARVYRAVGDSSGQVLCLKVQRADARWEVYVVDELRRRLGVAFTGHIMPISLAFLYTNGTIICTEYQAAGTLLQLRNKIPFLSMSSDTMALLFTAQMLAIVDDLHSAGIVHADIKPDNFLLRMECLEQTIAEAVALKAARYDPASVQQFPSQHLLQLIDFGRSIDMTLLPPGTQFRRRVNTDCFACPEMLSGQRWSRHTDLFGVAATAYLLLFGNYMKIVCPKQPGQRWTVPSGTEFRRFWSSKLWREFFDQFLNLPQRDDQLPDLVVWRRRFMEPVVADTKLRDKLSDLLSSLRSR